MILPSGNPLHIATSIRIATPKGVLRPTLCNARATNAKPKVIPVRRLLQDKNKLGQASGIFQLETDKIPH